MHAVDEGRVEEGERQRHADRARSAVLARGEFGHVADRSLDEFLEPGPTGRDAPDQPVPFVRLHRTTERGRGVWFEKGPSHSRRRFDPGDRQRFGLASVLWVDAILDLEAIAQYDDPNEMRVDQSLALRGVGRTELRCVGLRHRDDRAPDRSGVRRGVDFKSMRPSLSSADRSTLTTAVSREAAGRRWMAEPPRSRDCMAEVET